jgi:hypothetical protein
MLVAADHDHQRPRLHLGNASRNRRVEHGRSERADAPRDLPAHGRADRAQVDPDHLGGQAGEDSVRAGGNHLEHAFVGNGAEHDVGGLGHLAWCVAPLQALLHELVRMLSVSLLPVDGVPGGEEASGHISAHVPEADEADLRCRRRCHLMPSLRVPPHLTRSGLMISSIGLDGIEDNNRPAIL